MSPVTPLRGAPWREEHVDAQSLEALVLASLETLVHLAESQGQLVTASRLLEAARHVRQDPDSGADDQLTAREWEVARLVAHGCSNRQIAHELVVSDRTVDTHVSHILHKLGLSSRAQIAAWVVEHRRSFAAGPRLSA